MGMHGGLVGRRRRWVGALGIACATVASSCSAPSKGALILAVSTDMQTPKDIDLLSVYITTSGAPKFDYLGRVLPDGTVSLPSTLAIVEPDDPGAEVRVRVIGFQERGQAQNARVLRDVLTTVPHQRTALLRVPLNFLDDGSGQGVVPPGFVPGPATGVPEGTTRFDATTIRSRCDFDKKRQTSINGVCADASVESSSLPTYSDSQVFGEGGTSTSAHCFDVQACFQGASPVSGIDTASCTFQLPAGTDATKINLALATASTGALVAGSYLVPLDNDPGAGWTVAGGIVRLAPGVCSALAGGAQLYLVGSPISPSPASCTPKTPSDPVCEPTGADASVAGGDAPMGVDASPEGSDATTGVNAGATYDATTASDAPTNGQDATVSDGAPGDAPGDGASCTPVSSAGGLAQGTPCGSADAGSEGGVPACGGGCASGLCAPDPGTGQLVCESSSGCHVAGDVCTQDSDCCGSASLTGDSGAPVTCMMINACGVGVCGNPLSCRPNGAICRLQTSTCNAPTNCCSGSVQTMNTCRQDNLGVPRCTYATCLGAGAACATSADCCNGAPCVPAPADGGGPPLVCYTAQCVPSSGPCTTWADCCAGLVCTAGACVPGTQTCALAGQPCTTAADCCYGATCPAGRCQP